MLVKLGHHNDEAVGRCHRVVGILDQPVHTEIGGDQLAIDRPARSGERATTEPAAVDRPVSAFEPLQGLLDGIVHRNQVMAQGRGLGMTVVRIAGHDGRLVFLRRIEQDFLQTIEKTHLLEKLTAYGHLHSARGQHAADRHVAGHRGPQLVVEIALETPGDLCNDLPPGCSRMSRNAPATLGTFSSGMMPCFISMTAHAMLIHVYPEGP